MNESYTVVIPETFYGRTLDGALNTRDCFIRLVRSDRTNRHFIQHLSSSSEKPHTLCEISDINATTSELTEIFEAVLAEKQDWVKRHFPNQNFSATASPD